MFVVCPMLHHKVNSLYVSRQSAEIMINPIICVLIVILISFPAGQTAKTDVDEICEDENLNLQFCALRPNIHSALDKLTNDSYLVCEEDVLGSCNDKVVLKDKAGSTKKQTTTSTTTTMPPALATTIRINSCPSCWTVCEEERSRCDLSVSIMTTTTTFDQRYFAFSRNESSSSSGRGQFNNAKKNNNEPANDFGADAGLAKFQFPTVLYDVFRKKPKPVQSFQEIKDQLHLSQPRNPNNANGRARFSFDPRRRKSRRSKRSINARTSRRVPRSQNGYMNPSDEEKLVNLYGREMFNQHRGDFANVENMRQQEPVNHADHVNIPRMSPSEDFIQQQMDKVRLHYLQQQQKQAQYPQEMPQQRPLSVPKEPITPSEIKRMLKELLERLEIAEVSNDINYQPQSQPTAPVSDRCTLHGLWLSTVTGVGIQLEPISEHDLKLNIIDMGVSNGFAQNQDSEPFISSEWSGRAVVSTESATTISIVLQEKWVNRDREPKTAVFVGQCVICTGSPTIQGTWVVFPESQTCYEETSTKVPPRADVMYLLK